MKRVIVITALVLSQVLLALAFNADKNEFVDIPPCVQRTGDSAAGYKYLTTGDFLKSGVPYNYFTLLNGKNENNYLNRTGKNATVSFGYNVIQKNGVDMVIPTCFQCHASMFEGELVIGLGNNNLDFSNTNGFKYKGGLKVMQVTTPKQYKAARAFFTSFAATFPLMETEVRGVNPADKLAVILVAHRDPQTLKWSDKELLPIPQEVIPTDVPAWWLMKKKNAMFYSGFAVVI